MSAEQTARENADTALEAALAAEIAATNSDFTRVDNKDAAQDGRLDVLEAAIIEDDQMATETFAGAGFVYNLANPVQEDQASLVDVFVNGHRVFVELVAGPQVTIANPGYVIDAQDEVVFVYQF